MGKYPNSSASDEPGLQGDPQGPNETMKETNLQLELVTPEVMFDPLTMASIDVFEEDGSPTALSLSLYYWHMFAV